MTSGVFPLNCKTRARSDENGEVSWHVDDAPSVLGELADAGRVVLGLDVRDYDEDGSFLEVAWSVYEGADPIEAREEALGALSREERPGDWIVVTWGGRTIRTCRFEREEAGP